MRIGLNFSKDSEEIQVEKADGHSVYSNAAWDPKIGMVSNSHSAGSGGRYMELCSWAQSSKSQSENNQVVEFEWSFVTRVSRHVNWNEVFFWK